MAISKESKFSTTFSEEFQLEILTLCFRETGFTDQYVKMIKRSHFNSQIHQVLFSILSEFLVEFGRPPSLPEALNQLSAMYPEPQEHLYSANSAVLMALFEKPMPAKDYIVSRLITFVKKSEINQAIFKVLNSQEAMDPDAICTQFEKIKEISAISQDLGVFGSDFKSEIIKAGSDRNGMRSSFGSLDRLIRGGGGVKPGELFTILGPSNVGKTGVLINLCRGYMASGYKVVYYTLEQSQEDLVAKMVASMTNVPINKITGWAERDPKFIHQVFDLLDEYQIFTDGGINIQSYSGTSIGLEQIRAHLALIKKYKDFEPDVIVVDYADLLKPPVAYKNQSYRELGDLYVHLRNLGQQNNAVVLTASQVNREGTSINYDFSTKSKKETVDKLQQHHVSGSMQKIEHSDFVVSLRDHQKYLDWDSSDALMIGDMMKNRQGPQGDMIFFRCGFDKARMEDVEMAGLDFSKIQSMKLYQDSQQMLGI